MKFALKKGTAKPEQFNGPVGAGYLAPYDNWNNRVAVQRFVEDIPIEDGHPTKGLGEALERQLPDLAHHPHLVIWGNQDFVPKVRSFRKRCPQRGPCMRLDQGAAPLVQRGWEWEPPQGPRAPALGVLVRISKSVKNYNITIVQLSKNLFIFLNT